MVPGGIRLREATIADAETIVRIWQEGWADAHLGHVPEELVAARTPEWFADRVHRHIADTIVAVRADAVIGFVTVDDDLVDQLYLERAGRGAGIGAMLLDAGEARVIAAGHESAWLVVARGNESGRRFYARHGWVDEGPGRHPAPVPGGTVDVDCHHFRSPRR